MQNYNDKLATQLERKKERRVHTKFSPSSFSGIISPSASPLDYSSK